MRVLPLLLSGREPDEKLTPSGDRIYPALF